MNVIALIPARSGSKGIVDKNIKELAGHPLIAFSIRAAKLAKCIDRVIVSTDTEEYRDIALRYGAEVPFLRPSVLSEDHSTDYDFVKHFIDWNELSQFEMPDLIVHLRPTTPLRHPDIIDEAVSLIRSNPASTALRSGHEMPETAYKQFEIHGKYFKSIFNGSLDLEKANMPRQNFPKTFAANGYVDILKTEHITKHLKLHGNQVLSMITELSHEIDTKEDFEYLEWLVERNMDIVDLIFGD
jgi:CMP-N,N'-diacetyllegionaminic acid synthase